MLLNKQVLTFFAFCLPTSNHNEMYFIINLVKTGKINGVSMFLTNYYKELVLYKGLYINFTKFDHIIYEHRVYIFLPLNYNHTGAPFLSELIYSWGLKTIPVKFIFTFCKIDIQSL